MVVDTQPQEKKLPVHKSIYLLPNLITSLSMFMGFLSMVWAVQSRFEEAGLAIVLSALLDGMDGKVARLTHTASEFGVQYDSLADLIAFGAYLAVLLAVMALLFPAIRSCAFDPNFARTQGLPVYAINLMMTVLTSVCIVLTIRLIGIMLLMSLFTMPQMIAELRTHRLLPLMCWSVVISLACSLGGVLLSVVLSVPVSASIVLLLIILYAVARIGAGLSRQCNKTEQSSL